MYILYKYTLRHTFANLHELQLLEQNQPVLGKNMINFLDYFFFGSMKC